MCNNAEKNVKQKSKIASLEFCGMTIYSELNYANKVVPVAEATMLDNSKKSNSYKSLKIS